MRERAKGPLAHAPQLQSAELTESAITVQRVRAGAEGSPG